MTARFVAALHDLAALSDERCSDPWEWPGHSGALLQVRDALYRSLEEEFGALTTHAPPASEAARMLAVGQRAWGELRGLLLGVADGDLDRTSAPGQWTVRQVLEHVLLVERRYRTHVEYALSRSDSEPVRLDLQLELADSEAEGGVRDWVARLAAERGAGAWLAAATPDQLVRPTVWAGYMVDVRFRLLRFAGHIAEHTVQVERTLEALGWRPGEAHRIVRRISAARGAHELSTEPTVLEGLDAAHAARAAALTARA